MARSLFRRLLSQPWRVRRSGAEGRKLTTRPLALEQLEDRTLLSALQAISLPPANQPGTGDSFSTSLSADGRFTVFTSTATDLVPGQADRNNNQNVFLYDKQTATVTLVKPARRHYPPIRPRLFKSKPERTRLTF
jgi:hypothetical protein